MSRPSFARATGLLVRLRLRRLWNLGRSGFGRKLKTARRTGQAPKKEGGALLLIVIFGVAVSALYQRNREMIHGLHGLLPGIYFTQAVAMYATSAAIGALLLFVGSREMAKAEWDLEWLLTLPIPFRSLLAMKIIEGALTSTTGILLLGPFFCAFARDQHWHFWTAILVPLALLPFLLLFSAFRLCLDTGLRLRLSAFAMRNIQAVVAIGASVFFFLSMGLQSSGKTLWPARTVTWVQGWMDGIPSFLAVEIFSKRGWAMLAPLGALWAEALGFAALALGLTELQLRRGINSTSDRIGRRAGMPKNRLLLAQKLGRSWLNPVVRRDLLLLLRDQTYLAQVAIVPILFVIGGVKLEGGSDLLFGKVSTSIIQAGAFLSSGYCLFNAAFLSLNTDVKPLWLLFTLPDGLRRVLRTKARFWAGFAIFFPLLFLALRAGHTRLWESGTAWLWLLVFAGLPLFSWIAVCMGMLSLDAFTTQPEKRVRVGQVYIYFILLIGYAGTIANADPWTAFVGFSLALFLAYAMGQKVDDRIPYLLDPLARSPHITVLSGVGGLIAYFAAQLGGQALTAWINHPRPDLPAGVLITYGMLFAGAVTYGGLRLIYWRGRATGLPSIWSGWSSRNLALALAGGIVPAVAVHAYHRFFPVSATSAIPLWSETWLVLGAVILSPLFEEFLFRGIVFSSLKRSMGKWRAVMISAFVFAIVHPQPSFFPVMALGISAALVYDEAGGLWASMLAHAVYNALVLAR